MSKDFYQSLAACLLLVAIGQHVMFGRAIEVLSKVLHEIEETARMQNGWVYIELSD